jgi:hypothetical protein
MLWNNFSGRFLDYASTGIVTCRVSVKSMRNMGTPDCEMFDIGRDNA